MTLFYKHGRGEELGTTLDWVTLVLRRRAHLNGTPFYPMPEAFLYFFYRFLQHIEHLPLLHGELASLLRSRLQERVGMPVDATSLAIRLIACQAMGVRDPVGLQTLLSMQLADGGWPVGKIYAYASKKLAIGNRGLTTAWAIQAIEKCQYWLEEDRAAIPSSLGIV